MTRDKNDGAAGGETENPAPEQTDGAAATDDARPSGTDAAVEALRAAFGDDVVTLWRMGGPRKSHTDEVVCVLVEIGDQPRRIVVQSFESGNFKLFAEVGGKTAEQMVGTLGGLFPGNV